MQKQVEKKAIGNSLTLQNDILEFHVALAWIKKNCTLVWKYEQNVKNGVFSKFDIDSNRKFLFECIPLFSIHQMFCQNLL